MNILIVETVWMGDARYKFLDKTLLTAFSILPTLQARELAAITPKHHSVKVVNERYEPVNFHDRYDLVHINYVTSTAPRAYEIADTFRNKDIPVVLSGFHASAMPAEAKQHADSVLIGRNELSWLALLSDFEHQRLQPFYQPVPYECSTKLPLTEVSLPGFVLTGALEATRGCPHHCDFCPETNIPEGASFYKRPVDDVITEVKKIPQKFLMFYDTSLTIHPAYTKELFKKMKGLHKKFSCNGNVDVLARDPELVRLSKEAGCIAWLVGFESISQNTLDTVGKTTNTVDEYIEAVHNIHENSMAVIGEFMLGFDTDTPETFQKTLTVIKELEIDIADFSILTPFPGTPLYKRLEKEGRILTKDWMHYNLKTVVFKPNQITPEELLQGVQQMYSIFYAPLYTIKRIIGSLHRGAYPFLIVFARNTIATMSSRRLFTQQQKKDHY